MIVKLTPTVLQTGNPFTFTVSNFTEAVRKTVCLLSYQHFLGQEGHSQNVHKGRIELLSDDNKTHLKNQNFVNQVNNHHYIEQAILNTSIKTNDFDNFKLRIKWFPQIPCNPFLFPTKDLYEAKAIQELIGDYDLYLLNACSNMREDYCNLCVLEMHDPNPETLPDDKWTDWFHEGNEEYFDNLEEFLSAKQLKT